MLDLGQPVWRYFKLMIEDAGLPDLDILKLFASFGYDLAYKKKIKVLVHCQQGGQSGKSAQRRNFVDAWNEGAGDH
jgi:hypothetical protein